MSTSSCQNDSKKAEDLRLDGLREQREAELQRFFEDQIKRFILELVPQNSEPLGGLGNHIDRALHVDRFKIIIRAICKVAKQLEGQNEK